MTAHSRLAGRTILVVDDDWAITDLISDVLADEGVTVIVAHDGVEALHAMAAQVPDLLLLDLAMPHMDGSEVMARLRATGVTTPVVIVSAQPDASRFAHMAAGLLRKPFDIDDLVSTVENIVSPVR